MNRSNLKIQKAFLKNVIFHILISDDFNSEDIRGKR